MDTHWTLLDTTTLPCTTATSRGSCSSRSIAPGCRPVLPSEPWSSVRGERLSARIIHCHGKIIRSVRSTESRRCRAPASSRAGSDSARRNTRSHELQHHDASGAGMQGDSGRLGLACVTVEAGSIGSHIAQRTGERGAAHGDLLLDSRGQSRTVTTRDLIE